MRTEICKPAVLLLVVSLTIPLQAVTPIDTLDGIDSIRLSFHTPSADDADVTWTSRWQSQPLILANDTNLVGDHVVLNATFPHFLNVTHCSMTLENGFRLNTTHELVVPSDPGGQFDGLINHTEFSWVIVTGIPMGIKVNITCNFTNGDSDIMAWSGAQEYLEFTYENNLVDMASGDKPETDVIIWESDSDTMYVGCLNYDRSPGNWTFFLQVGVYKVLMSDTDRVVCDTYTLDSINQTVNVRVSGLTDSNETLVYDFENITLSNFFKPEVTVNYPIELGSDLYNFTWIATDKNAEDVNYYSVWLSIDGGYSYQSLARNLTTTNYIWDAYGFMERDNYIVRIRAFSVDLVNGLGSVDDESNYWPGDYSDGLSVPFCAGYVHGGGGRIYVKGIESQEELTIIKGELQRSINWTLDVSTGPVIGVTVNYEIFHNDTLVLNDTYYAYNSWYGDISQRTIVFNLDSLSLSIGTHNITIVVTTPERFGCNIYYEPVIVKDNILVHVVEHELPTPVDPVIILGGLVVVGVGAVVLIVFASLSTNKYFRKYEESFQRLRMI